MWLRQVHGAAIADLDAAYGGFAADGSVTRTPGTVCAVLTADCLPVLLADRDSRVVAAAHAGWRGLAAGVIEAAVAELSIDPASVLAWLGPAIGMSAFEVGEDVVDAFAASDVHEGFAPKGRGKWNADLYAIARARLEQSGVRSVNGGGYCTFTDSARFFSYRRERETGRMAAVLWIGP